MRFALAAALVFASAVAGLPAAADEDPGAQLALVVAGSRDGEAQVGVEIALAPGWKTYWRTPGDAGIAPSFDASASRGLASVAVRYPVPERFGEAGFESIGYIAPVLLPLDVTLADPKTPADLDLVVHLGLCREICVPVEAHLKGRLDPKAPLDATLAARLAAARAAVPGEATSTSLPRIVSLERFAEGSAAPKIAVGMVLPAGVADDAVDLLVEGPSPDWALPQPVKAQKTTPPPGSADLGRLYWEFALDGLPAKADTKAASLRFTLKAGSSAVEQTVGLDGAGLLP